MPARVVLVEDADGDAAVRLAREVHRGLCGFELHATLHLPVHADEFPEQDALGVQAECLRLTDEHVAVAVGYFPRDADGRMRVRSVGEPHWPVAVVAARGTDVAPLVRARVPVAFVGGPLAAQEACVFVWSSLRESGVRVVGPVPATV